MNDTTPAAVSIRLPNGALAGWPVLIHSLRLAEEKTGLNMVFQGLIEQIEAQIPPPKPDEPTGLGAVVEDEDGLRWSLLPPTVNGKRWACWDEPRIDRDYADIAAVRVLSEGVAL